jgi:cytochrome c oxidase cbb3-type subunit 3
LCLALVACNGSHDHAPVASQRSVDPPIGPIPGPANESTKNPNVFQDDNAALQQGRELFKRYNCYGCHGLHGGGGMGPSLRDRDWLYGDTAPHIYDSIAEGRGHGMPAWYTRIPERQLWQLTAYIQSLETEREPDPPR